MKPLWAGTRAQPEVERATQELQRVYHDAGVYVQQKDQVVDHANMEAENWAQVAQCTGWHRQTLRDATRQRGGRYSGI